MLFCEPCHPEGGFPTHRRHAGQRILPPVGWVPNPPTTCWLVNLTSCRVSSQPTSIIFRGLAATTAKLRSSPETLFVHIITCFLHYNGSMPDYRRVQIPGGTFFITIVTYKRFPIFLKPAARTVLSRAWKEVTDRFPFTTDAICLLPEHIHALITLPESETNYSIRVREIKRLFTKEYLEESGPVSQRNPSRIDKQEATIWQRRFFEHTIRDERDLQTHFDYIHFNPVKHGLVEHVRDWEWSSFHRHVKIGFYPADWGEGLDFKEDPEKFGE